MTGFEVYLKTTQGHWAGIETIRVEWGFDDKSLQKFFGEENLGTMSLNCGYPNKYIVYIPKLIEYINSNEVSLKFFFNKTKEQLIEELKKLGPVFRVMDIWDQS